MSGKLLQVQERSIDFQQNSRLNSHTINMLTDKQLEYTATIANTLFAFL
jgi:hypothetical protein